MIRNMNNKEKYTDKDWEKLASLLSDETTYSSDELDGFREEDHFGTEKQWKDMGKIGNNKEIDVDKAWNNIYSRIEENGLLSKSVTIEKRFRMQTIIRIAASLLIITGLGITVLYLNNSGVLSGKIVVSANSGERNKEVFLPDGSKVFLNRNSELSYNKNPEKSSRNVTLKGEAFFDIKRDPSKPFIIDAGKANVKVLGTSFSVLTNNSYNAVEVFVKTGSVMLCDSSGNQMILEPGDIGTMDLKSFAKAVNKNPNYLSWNTDLLVYEKQTLDVVFADLKKVYNIDVIADNPEILKNPLTATYEKEPEETIIRLLCSTFTLSYKKDGAVYHLSKK
jgi:ferric-dicitrate binding protein FerR (iron transport regulator)